MFPTSFRDPIRFACSADEGVSSQLARLTLDRPWSVPCGHPPTNYWELDEGPSSVNNIDHLLLALEGHGVCRRQVMSKHWFV